MSPDVHILLSGALSFGVPLLLAVRELVVLGRESSGGGPAKGGDARGQAPAPTPPAGEPSSLPPLPPCLVEALRGGPEPVGTGATRVRVLEEA